MLIDPFTVPKDATDEVKKMVKENQDVLEKEVEAAIKKAVVYLQDYMKVFAGEAEAKKITDKTVMWVYLPDGADPTKFEYKDGVIEGIEDEERKKDW